jgi:hypothetical protein
MSRYRWGVSLLILYHLTAVAAALLPSPSDLPADRSGRQPTVLDSAASALRSIESPAYRWTAPLRAITYPYRDAGLRQKWDMFSAPKTADQYVRVDYLITDAAARRSVVRELVLPSQRDDRIRLRHDFRDKAIINAIDDFMIRRKHEAAGAQSAGAADDLGAVAKYFAERLRATYLKDSETIQRTEVWYGLAPIPPPGLVVDADVREARDQALALYYAGPARSSASDVELPAIGATLREADIVWVLEHIEWR